MKRHRGNTGFAIAALRCASCPVFTGMTLAAGMTIDVMPDLIGHPEGNEKTSWEYWIPVFTGMTPSAGMTIDVMPDLIGHPESDEKTSWEYWIRYRGSSLRFVSRFHGNDTECHARPDRESRGQ